MSDTAVIQPASTSTILFGAWLKARRKELDLTRVVLAQRIGCAEITLQKIEQDQRRPSKQIAELLADALQVPAASREQFMQFARGLGELPMLNTLDDSAPLLRSPPPTNLPAPLTSFIDRTNELAAVQQRLLQTDVRLLTLVGPPGIGKTRLSIQVGQALLNHFADGVWFVALASISDPTNVLPAIAHLFEIADAGASPLLDRLQAYLRAQAMLLILDNFEPVLDAGPDVANLLKACPKLKVLATSRVPLRVYGEQEYPMPALSLPPKGTRLLSQQLAAFDSVKLFVARVQAFQPYFQLDADNAQAIVDICARMDGMPLAIELAASRLRRFTPQQLRDALHDAPLQTLAADARDVEPRQRTLRTAIQWSYDLLSPTERAAFNRLGVFAGGCTTEAALAVCELVDDSILHALADQNLIKRDSPSRWTILEMIREFALDTLAQMSGDALEQARQRHAEYFACILKFGDDEVYNITDVEQHNARAALRWLLDHKHPLMFQLADFMGWYFHWAGLLGENRRMHNEVLLSGIEMTPLLGYRWRSGATILANLQRDFKAALRHTDEALAIARSMNSQTLIADGLLDHGMVYIEMSDYAQAKEASLEALKIGRSIQEPEHIAGALCKLGNVALEEGDMSQASAYYEEAYTLCQTPNWGQPIYASHTCKGMGEIALSRRDYDSALRFLRESLDYSKPAVTKSLMLAVLSGIIGTMPRRTSDDVQRAAQIWGAVEALNERMGVLHAPGDRRRINALIAEARTHIAPKTFAAAWAEGRELSLDEAIALAMV